LIYSNELEIMDATAILKSVQYLDLYLEIDDEECLKIKNIQQMR